MDAVGDEVDMAEKARFSLCWQVDGNDEEFAEAHDLLTAGRILLRRSRTEPGGIRGRCMVVFDRHEKNYVEPEVMVKVYRKLMR